MGFTALLDANILYPVPMRDINRGVSNMNEMEANGHKIEWRPDGSMKVTTSDGRVLVVDKDGNVQVNIETIKSVGLENIFDLKSHIILREGELTVHKIEFHDGGLVKLSFTDKGKLVEFSCHHVGQTITKEGEIIIRSYVAAENT